MNNMLPRPPSLSLPPFPTQALGAVTMAIGIWGIVVGGRGGYDIITGENTLAATAILLTAGALTLAVAGLGIWGAWGMWRPILILVSPSTKSYTIYYIY